MTTATTPAPTVAITAPKRLLATPGTLLTPLVLLSSNRILTSGLHSPFTTHVSQPQPHPSGAAVRIRVDSNAGNQHRANTPGVLFRKLTHVLIMAEV